MQLYCTVLYGTRIPSLATCAMRSVLHNSPKHPYRSQSSSGLHMYVRVPFSTRFNNHVTDWPRRTIKLNIYSSTSTSIARSQLCAAQLFPWTPLRSRRARLFYLTFLEPLFSGTIFTGGEHF